MGLLHRSPGMCGVAGGRSAVVRCGLRAAWSRKDKGAAPPAALRLKQGERRVSERPLRDRELSGPGSACAGQAASPPPPPPARWVVSSTTACARCSHMVEMHASGSWSAAACAVPCACIRRAHARRRREGMHAWDVWERCKACTPCSCRCCCICCCCASMHAHGMQQHRERDGAAPGAATTAQRLLACCSDDEHRGAD